MNLKHMDKHELEIKIGVIIGELKPKKSVNIDSISCSFSDTIYIINGKHSVYYLQRHDDMYDIFVFDYARKSGYVIAEFNGKAMNELTLVEELISAIYIYEGSTRS